MNNDGGSNGGGNSSECEVVNNVGIGRLPCDEAVDNVERSKAMMDGDGD